MGTNRSTGSSARRVALGLAALVLFAAGCSSNGSAGGGTTSAPTAPATSAATAPSTTAAAGPDFAQLDRLWVDYWATMTAADQAAAASRVAGFAGPDQLEVLQQLKGQIYGAGTSPGEIVHNPARAANGTVGATIKDCMILPGSRLSDGRGFVGEVTWTDGRWTLGSVQPTGGGVTQSACVPKAADDALLAAYRNWFVQLNAIARNPDPATPVLDQIASGDTYKQALRDLLASLKAKGEYIVELPPGTDLQPEVYAYAATRASVQSCRDTSPAYGRFKLDGTRVTEAEKPGLQSAYEVDLVLEGGTWKATEMRSTHSISCTKAPTSRGLAVVG